MRRYIFFIILLTIFTGCFNFGSLDKSRKRTVKTIRIINLDKKIKNIRGYIKGSQNIPVIDFHKYGDNDEVIFKGDILENVNSIKIEDREEIPVSSNRFRLKISDLRDNDILELINKKGKVKLKLKIRLY
jgi:hypothetical protein